MNDDDGVPDIADACNYRTSVRIMRYATPTATDGWSRCCMADVLRALQMHFRTMPRNGGTWMAMDTRTTTPV